MELSKSELEKACGSLTGLKKSILAWELVNNKRLTAPEKDMFSAHTIKNSKIEIIKGNLPGKYEGEIPISGHSILNNRDSGSIEFYKKIEEAINFLGDRFGTTHHNL
ncbi:hypothetical protein NFC81_14855 [Salinispirillum sp. LH 10-3-1]|uniref:Uncharacterized protein n=1 Tax=Salinispirillum sp. LH 10-3-1 TaxID=2952525 RepID=A0AB38YFX9_9GAMM